MIRQSGADPATQQALLIRALDHTAKTIHMDLDGFTDDTRTAQTPDLPNHPAWTLGHLALTLNRVAEHIDKQPLPESDFLTGDGFAGTRDRFDTESVCHGSTPSPSPEHYPTLDRAITIFDAATARLQRALETATDKDLANEVPWGSRTMPLADLASRMLFHNGSHAGQLLDLRRALKMGYQP